jgi:hypothetical protein
MKAKSLQCAQSLGKPKANFMEIIHTSASHSSDLGKGYPITTSLAGERRIWACVYQLLSKWGKRLEQEWLARLPLRVTLTGDMFPTSVSKRNFSPLYLESMF